MKILSKTLKASVSFCNTLLIRKWYVCASDTFSHTPKFSKPESVIQVYMQKIPHSFQRKPKEWKPTSVFVVPRRCQSSWSAEMQYLTIAFVYLKWNGNEIVWSRAVLQLIQAISTLLMFSWHEYLYVKSRKKITVSLCVTNHHLYRDCKSRTELQICIRGEFLFPLCTHILTIRDVCI